LLKYLLLSNPSHVFFFSRSSIRLQTRKQSSGSSKLPSLSLDPEDPCQLTLCRVLTAHSVALRCKDILGPISLLLSARNCTSQMVHLSFRTVPSSPRACIATAYVSSHYLGQL
jgi:hypothetical protein